MVVVGLQVATRTDRGRSVRAGVAGAECSSADESAQSRTRDSGSKRRTNTSRSHNIIYCVISKTDKTDIICSICFCSHLWAIGRMLCATNCGWM